MAKTYKSMNDVFAELDCERICDILSVGIDGIRYWGTTDYSSEEYKKAKNHLIEMGEEKDNLSWEQVLAQMLLDGGKIHIEDVEGDEDYSKDLTLENLKRGIEMFILNPQYHSCATSDMWDMDANDGDTVIQFALFEEIIFG